MFTNQQVADLMDNTLKIGENAVMYFLAALGCVLSIMLFGNTFLKLAALFVLLIVGMKIYSDAKRKIKRTIDSFLQDSE